MFFAFCRYPDELLNFVVPSDVRLGTGFPVPLEENGEETLILLAYVTYSLDNELCMTLRRENYPHQTVTLDNQNTSRLTDGSLGMCGVHPLADP